MFTVVCGTLMDANGYRVRNLHRIAKGITLLSEDYCKTSDVATTTSEDSDPKKSTIALCSIDAVWQWYFLGSGVVVVSLWGGGAPAPASCPNFRPPYITDLIPSVRVGRPAGWWQAGGGAPRRCVFAIVVVLNWQVNPSEISLTFLPKRRNSPIFIASEFPGQNPSLLFELVTFLFITD